MAPRISPRTPPGTSGHSGAAVDRPATSSASHAPGAAVTPATAHVGALPRAASSPHSVRDRRGPSSPAYGLRPHGRSCPVSRESTVPRGWSWANSRQERSGAGSRVPASSPTSAGAVELLPPALGLAVVHHEVVVAQVAGGPERQRAGADAALECHGAVAQRAVGDRDRPARDRVVDDLVPDQDLQLICPKPVRRRPVRSRVRGRPATDAPPGPSSAEDGRRPGSRRGRDRRTGTRSAARHDARSPSATLDARRSADPRRSRAGSRARRGSRRLRRAWRKRRSRRRARTPPAGRGRNRRRMSIRPCEACLRFSAPTDEYLNR
jgi:hypothetical protein